MSKKKTFQIDIQNIDLGRGFPLIGKVSFCPGRACYQLQYGLKRNSSSKKERISTLALDDDGEESGLEVWGNLAKDDGDGGDSEIEAPSQSHPLFGAMALWCRKGGSESGSFRLSPLMISLSDAG